MAGFRRTREEEMEEISQILSDRGPFDTFYRTFFVDDNLQNTFLPIPEKQQRLADFFNYFHGKLEEENFFVQFDLTEIKKRLETLPKTDVYVVHKNLKATKPEHQHMFWLPRSSRHLCTILTYHIDNKGFNPTGRPYFYHFLISTDVTEEFV